MMAFLMAVLTIHFIIRVIINASNKENKGEAKEEVQDIKHPAEYMLR